MINKLPTRLRALRIEKGITQNDLAHELHVPRVTYTHYELGKRTPDLDTIIEVARYYDVTLDYLIGVSDDRRPASARQAAYTFDEGQLSSKVADNPPAGGTYGER